MMFDAKMTFEKHLRSVFIAAAQRLGIIRKSWRVFHDRSLLLRSFWSFVLPVLEYCSAVWCSVADSHLKLLDRVVRVLLLLKKVGSARLGESDIHPISPKTPAPQYQPIDRKKRKGKRVEEYSRDRAA